MKAILTAMNCAMRSDILEFPFDYKPLIRVAHVRQTRSDVVTKSVEFEIADKVQLAEGTVYIYELRGIH